MFKVNGKTPDVGADQCKLNAGDKVEFFYICDYNTYFATQSSPTPSTDNSGSRIMCYLKTFDPTVPMMYFLCVMSICVFTSNPYLQACSLVGGVVMLILLKGRKSIKLLLMCLAVITVMGLTNPLFVHRGLTELFYIGEAPYTLEALLYGISLGSSIASLLIWFSVFNAVVSQDDILAVFGKRLPKTALVISMILGFIPKLRQKYTELGHAQHASGATRRKNPSPDRSACSPPACIRSRKGNRYLHVDESTGLRS